MYDVIVVGARCGGAATAMLLARSGHRVLLVDRAVFPSDMRLSTHLVWPAGLARLARWGLLDALAETGCPPLAEAVFDVGPFALRGGLPAVDGVDVAYVPRRRILDGLLVEAAVAAGAELWEGVLVEDLLVDGGAVVGVRGRCGGREVTARADLVVGADGTRSRVAELVDAPRYHVRPAVQGSYWSYWSGVPSEWVLYLRDGWTAYAFPTHHDLTVVGVNWTLRTVGQVEALSNLRRRGNGCDFDDHLVRRLTSCRSDSARRWLLMRSTGVRCIPRLEDRVRNCQDLWIKISSRPWVGLFVGSFDQLPLADAGLCRPVDVHRRSVSAGWSVSRPRWVGASVSVEAVVDGEEPAAVGLPAEDIGKA